MSESDYWLELEYRVSAEFAEMADNRLRFLWCDGFTPLEYLLDDSLPRITGRTWICNGPKQEEFDFTLFLKALVDSRADVDWSALIPPTGVTRWIAVDVASRRIQFDPRAAVPDAIERRPAHERGLRESAS